MATRWLCDTMKMSGQAFMDWGAAPGINIPPAYHEEQIGGGGSTHRDAYLKHIAEKKCAAGTYAASSTGVPSASAAETGSSSGSKDPWIGVAEDQRSTSGI